MAEITLDTTSIAAIEKLENEISEKFQTMLANDAMLALHLKLDDVSDFDLETVKSSFAGDLQLIRTPVEWDGESESLFVIKQDESKAFLENIRGMNDAIDNLDLIFENWNVAAAGVLQEHLESAPAFGESKIEERELSDGDFKDDSIFLVYDLSIAGEIYKLGRIATPRWAEAAAAADIEVTTVDDVPSLPVDIMDPDQESVGVSNVDFGKLEEAEKKSDSSSSIAMLYDINLNLVVELGRTKKQVKEILEIGKGSIIELEKLAGDPVEIYVNDKKLAEGEVVVVDDHFGVRITSLIKQSERIQNLGEL